MTSLKTPRAALVLILGIIASGAFGMWFAISELQAPEMGYAVGATALVTFILTALALIRRSWARIPLLVTGFYAGALFWDGFFTEYDPSAGADSLGYLVYNVILIFFAVLALIVSALDRPAAAREPEAHKDH